MSRRVVDCVVGLQWGSEGKGKIARYLSDEYNALVRSGGPQAGHTFYISDQKFINRQLPCGIVNPDCLLYLSTNTIIDLEVLAKELKEHKIFPDRLMIDKNAMVVTKLHKDIEVELDLNGKLGSTLQGVGAAQSEKILRLGYLFSHYACEDPELYFYSGKTTDALHQQIENGHSILIEGTQGYGLSLNFGEYPFVTSRDVTSSALITDCGIPPKAAGRIIGVMRTYPIRVAGNSGPTGSEEISWGEITKRSGSKKPITEKTSVTKRTRRVFEQNYDVLREAIKVNGVDQLALTFIDYINCKDYGKQNYQDLSKDSKKYIKNIEDELNVPVTLIGTGPKNEHIIDLRFEHNIGIPCPEENPKSHLSPEFFTDNFCGHPWDSDYIADFIERKMTTTSSEPWACRIFS